MEDMWSGKIIPAIENRNKGMRKGFLNMQNKVLKDVCGAYLRK